MNNKRNTYILLLLVLSIWGMVIYKFFSATQEEPRIGSPGPTELKPYTFNKPDSVIIDVNYRDPFLGKTYSTTRATTSRVRSSKAKEAEQPIVWPQVIYKGIVSDAKNKKKIFILIINGHRYLMKEKENIDDIILKSGNRQSVIVQYNGDLTTVYLEE
jgi:hypothetical protein